MLSSSIFDGSPNCCLIGSCGIMLSAFSTALVVVFSKTLKCCFHLSMIAFLSFIRILLSAICTGSRNVRCRPYTSLRDAKKALESFHSDRSWISAAFFVHQSLFICHSFLWSSDFTFLYSSFIDLVHLSCRVLLNSLFFSFTRFLISTFDSSN